MPVVSQDTRLTSVRPTSQAPETHLRYEQRESASEVADCTAAEYTTTADSATRI
jgi:hypothetical protein